MIRRVTTVVVSVLGLSILMLAVGAIAGPSASRIPRPPQSRPARFLSSPGH